MPKSHQTKPSGMYPGKCRKGGKKGEQSIRYLRYLNGGTRKRPRGKRSLLPATNHLEKAGGMSWYHNRKGMGGERGGAEPKHREKDRGKTHNTVSSRNS